MVSLSNHDWIVLPPFHQLRLTVYPDIEKTTICDRG